ncbi:NAD(P)/FAD-dependent oxidoreductase [Halolamina salifodinae]|uniref:Thioredoxin reductase n=1 Tax=Halolamina salifodinae TaxID=1202767 RepID=A0A8T4GU44_9EURY|nr:FAD-dependent oxidoreductase [Halolamina salifodinae]MBP1986567.1 thioredoxin reductase [Halolamina salifodinae]
MSEPTDTGSDGEPQHREVLIVGGGVAGLTAAVYTARAGLDTLVYDGGESILRRNAHLENFPGFPAGVNPRLFADMLHAQATRNGVDLVDGQVTRLEHAESGEDGGFLATAEDGESIRTDRVVAASWSDTDYLDPVAPDIRSAGSKAFVEDDEHGRTSVDGLYAAGRLAERYHQAVVAAGDGAETAITLIHDSETPFYHDWVAPEGYFTDRDREVPPGCEEIDETERAARRAESRAAMREYFAEEHGERQRTHPSLVDDETGRLGSE